MLKLVITYRQLTALLLLAAVLFLPMESMALDPVPAQDSCVCQLLPGDLPAGDSEEGEQGGAGDCCDSEERCSDAVESCAARLHLHIPAARLFYPNTRSFFPKVYLSIFVPPQS